MAKMSNPQWIYALLENLNVKDFITSIESEPAIWDSSKPEYSNNVETEKSWRNICLKVDADFESRPEKEKNVLGKTLHRRWKSLRDCYSPELKKKKKSSKSGSDASNRKPYVYFEQLRFLEPIQCATESNVDLEEQESQAVENDQEDYSVLMYPQPSRSKKRKSEDDHLLDVLKKKITSSKAERPTIKPTQDADYMFLCSLLPELNKIPENLKLYVKSQIMNTILGVQNALNIASVPGVSRPPYQHNIANTEYPLSYPQYQNPNCGPQMYNFQQSSTQQINRNLNQPSGAFTPATYHNLERAQPNITPVICQASSFTNETSSSTVQATSPFSTGSNITEMSDDSGDFTFFTKK